MRSGDLILVTDNVAAGVIPADPSGRLSIAAYRTGPIPILGLQTMNSQIGAGLHSSIYGPLPYFPSFVAVDRLVVLRTR